MSIQPIGSMPPPISNFEQGSAVKTDAPAVRGTPGSNRSPSVSDDTTVSLVAQLDQSSGAETLDDAVRRIKEFVQPINDSIQFSLDDDTGRTVVKVIDLQTQEVLRQIPSEEALNIAKALDRLQGLLIQNKA